MPVVRTTSFIMENLENSSSSNNSPKSQSKFTQILTITNNGSYSILLTTMVLLFVLTMANNVGAVPIPMKIGIVVEPPFVIRKIDTKIQPVESCHKVRDTGEEYCGYLIDLLYYYKNHLNFDPQVTKYDKIGGPEEEDSLIGALIRKELDVAFAPISVSSKLREKVVFSKPFMDADLSLMMRLPERGQQLKFDSIKKLSENFTMRENSQVLEWWKRNIQSEISDLWKEKDSTPIDEILDRVISKNQVFLEESPRAAHFASIREKCDIFVKDLTNIASYALAFRKDFPRDWPKKFQRFDDDMLTIRENGFLDLLYDRWWINGKHCPRPGFKICGNSGTKSPSSSASNDCEDTFNNNNKFQITYRVIYHNLVFPFTYSDTCNKGRFSGYAVDLINDLEDRIGFVKYLEDAETLPENPGPFSGMIHALKNARGQIATGPFTIPQKNTTNSAQNTTIFQERSKSVKFSHPIMRDVRIGILALNRNPLINDNNFTFDKILSPDLPEESQATTLVMIKDGYVIRFLEESKDVRLNQLVKHSGLVLLNNMSEAICKIKANANSIWIDEHPFMSAFAAKDHTLSAAVTDVMLGDYAFALQKEDRSICQVDRHLAEMEKSGQLDARYSKHWEPFEQAFCLDFMNHCR